jgi:hypothetical protein
LAEARFLLGFTQVEVEAELVAGLLEPEEDQMDEM